jgi:hypothetical protein
MAYNLPWRAGVRKLVVVLGDAPPLSPEPISGFTAAQMIARAKAIDPVEGNFVDLGALTTADIAKMAEETNGSIRKSSAGAAAQQIAAAIDTSLARPFAWVAGPYQTRIGVPVTFDGSGSYGVDSDIVSWDWDVDNDGTFDYKTTGPRFTHTYAAPYDGLVVLRVTDAKGRAGLASVSSVASRDGDTIPDAEDNCPDQANADQTDTDTDGLGDVCDPTPGLNLVDKPGVGVRVPAVTTPAPPPPTPTLPPPPSNAFAIAKIVPSSKRSGASLKVTLRLPGAGTIAGVARGSYRLRKAREGGRRRAGKITKLTLGRVYRTASAAGTVTVTIKVGSAGMAALRKAKRLAVTVDITYTPAGGTAATRSKTAILKAVRRK